MFGRLLIIALFLSHIAFAQKNKSRQSLVPSSELIYDNVQYIPEIKTIEFFNSKKEQSFPVITLGSAEKLVLRFDDLRSGGNRNIYYTVVHCDTDWQPTNITSLDYLDGIGNDRINFYRNSANTLQNYVHYEVSFPNFSVKPILAGNYLLKVYQDNDESKLLFTRRFFVLKTQFNLQAQVLPSNNVALRKSNQKISFTLQSLGVTVQNPYRDLKILILQNQRFDQSKWTKQPVFIKGNEFLYTDFSTNDFAAGNEFKMFDTRNLLIKSQFVYQITRDSLFHVSLYADSIFRNNQTYLFQFDENGKFFIRNLDRNADADYSTIDFALNSKQVLEGNVYILGLFNQYQKTNESKMVYNPNTKQYYLNMLLKQGVYNYHYSLFDDKGNILDDNFQDGSHFETENDYQILVYYRQPSSRFEELVAFAELNTSKNPKTTD